MKNAGNFRSIGVQFSHQCECVALIQGSVNVLHAITSGDCGVTGESPESRFSPSFVWVLGIKIKSSGLVASTFICRAMLPAPRLGIEIKALRLPLPRFPGHTAVTGCYSVRPWDSCH